MERYFNTEGLCNPEEHYMVRLDDRLRQIKRAFVDRGKYFVINRGRQYGKTTTLRALEDYLREDYVVLFVDFQLLTDANFENEKIFVRAFAGHVIDVLRRVQGRINGAVLQGLADATADGQMSMGEMFQWLGKLCETAEKPVVLMIDEVDSASNYQVFLSFLALLRGYYLDRKNRPAFHSVILAGVYDIKNLKLRIRPEAEHQYNSPWNIAADFDIRMDFSTEQIGSMLAEYETDYHTGMDIEAMAEEIFQYTSGYPYLVSAICKFLDEKLPAKKEFEDMRDVWTKEGVGEAVKALLNKNTPLFDSMVKQLDIFKDLRNMIEDILYQGKQIPFSAQEKSVNLGLMFGFLKEENRHIIIANRIFEMGLLNMFIPEEAVV